jgi:hypothetical protein
MPGDLEQPDDRRADSGRVAQEDAVLEVHIIGTFLLGQEVVQDKRRNVPEASTRERDEEGERREDINGTGNSQR